MKKIVLSLAAVLTFGVVSAQDLTSSKGENYLPQEGDWSIGFNASNAFKFVGNAFNGATSNEAPTFGSASELGFVGKQFTSDNEAYRYTANLEVAYSKTTNTDAVSSYGLTAGFGKEWRKGSTRLQGFYGADALVGFKVPETEKSFKFGVGVQGFVGAEYFFLPKMSLGAQYTYGVGLSYDKVGETGTFNFNLGGVGVASVLFNLYF